MNAVVNQGFVDTGIPWIGSIPASWKVCRIKDTTYVKGRVGWKGLTSSEYLETGYAHLVTGTDFRAKFIDWANCYKVDQVRYDDDPFIQLENGDLLITKDGTIGKLAIVSNLTGPACLNSGIFLVRPKHSYITAFLYWVLASEGFTVFCDLTSYGSTIQHLYQNVFERFSFPAPPLNVQEEIATFLDRQTAKIDRLVEEQTKLIKLLREKRQAVISHAITKGLDPNAALKNTGIEWLGEIPKHWGIAPLKWYSTCRSGGGLSAEEYEAYPSETKVVPVFGGNGLMGYTIAANTTTPVLAVGRVGALCGNVHLVDFPAWITDNALVLDPNEDAFELSYLAAILQMRNLNDIAAKTAQPLITGTQVADQRVPLPPIQEQKTIARFVSSSTQKIDALIDEATATVALLAERRAALISAAVTGRISQLQLKSEAISRDEVCTLIGLEIVSRLAHRPTFGRVKLQKLVYLAEVYAGIDELGGRYQREAAGPLDRRLITEIEALLQRNGDVAIDQPNGRGSLVSYRIIGATRTSEVRLKGVLGDRSEKFEQVLNKVGDLDTKGAEAVATLFAIWNDALLDHAKITDEEIFTAFLTEWHPEKPLKFKRDELHTWLGWMRRNGIIPIGQGPRTNTGRLVI